MGKTYLGYTQGKLEQKAEKRGITIEAYVRYLEFKQRFRKKKGKMNAI